MDKLTKSIVAKKNTNAPSKDINCNTLQKTLLIWQRKITRHISRSGISECCEFWTMFWHWEVVFIIKNLKFNISNSIIKSELDDNGDMQTVKEEIILLLDSSVPSVTSSVNGEGHQELTAWQHLKAYKLGESHFHPPLPSRL